MTTDLTWNLVAPPAFCLLLLLRGFPWSDVRQSQAYKTGTSAQVAVSWLILHTGLVNNGPDTADVSPPKRYIHWVGVMESTGGILHLGTVLRLQVIYHTLSNQTYAYLSLSVWFWQPHLSEHLRPLLHHQGPFVGVCTDIAVMLEKETTEKQKTMAEIIIIALKVNMNYVYQRFFGKYPIFWWTPNLQNKRLIIA